MQKYINYFGKIFDILKNTRILQNNSEYTIKQGKMVEQKRLYVDGINSSVMKKIVIFTFGKDNFLGIKNDAKRYEFIVVLSENVEQRQIDLFIEYWGRGGGLRIVRGIE